MTAEDKNSPDRGRREIKRALWANIGADAIDIGSIASGVAMGTFGRLPGVLLVGSALGAIGFGALGMKGL